MSHFLFYSYFGVKHLNQFVDFYRNLSIIIIVRGREKELTADYSIVRM